MSIYYVAPDHCNESRYELEKDQSWAVDEILKLDIADCYATDCAQDYWDNHDGWESIWPLEFHLYESEDAAKPFYKAVVSLDQSPVFSVSEVQP